MNSVYIKTKIYFGTNSLERLKQFNNEVIWIICDDFLVGNNSIDKLLKLINGSNKVNIFHDVVPDPPLNVIALGVSKLIKIKPTVVIGFGGGSAIDTAKGIIYILKKRNFIDKVKFMTIPTTSGTGSEVSSAIVITDSETRIKHAIFDDAILPDESILDAELTVSVPRDITANTGIDVLTHAMEAYVSINSNVYSDALCEKSFELTVQNLIRCYENGEDITARKNMQEASNLAGMAFNIAGLGINHSMAHQIGGEFHMPHGLSNSFLLCKVIDFNSKNEITLNKYAKLVYKTGMVDIDKGSKFAVEVLKSYIEAIKNIMNMKTKLRQCGIKKSEFDIKKASMAENALKDACTQSNAVAAGNKDLENILEAIY